MRNHAPPAARAAGPGRPAPGAVRGGLPLLPANMEVYVAGTGWRAVLGMLPCGIEGRGMVIIRCGGRIYGAITLDLGPDTMTGEASANA